MDADQVLAFHERAIGAFLGMRYTTIEKDRVVAEMVIEPRMYTQGDVVHGGIVMALGDCASAMGAVVNLPPGHGTATIDSKTSFLRRGSGDRLRAEAVPLHVGRKTSVWRASIFRGPGRPIAEVSQTQLVFPDEAAAAVAPALEASAEPPPVAGGVAEDRRRQIFEGAARMIAERGFAGATIRDIAAAAGMPVATMYQYIDRKEDVLYLIYDSFMREYIGLLEGVVRANASPAETLEAAIAATLAHFDRNHRFIKLMFQETRSLSPQGRAKVYALDSTYIGFWRDLLARMAADGTARVENPALIANVIYFLCAVWPLRYWTIGHLGREAVARELGAFIRRGLGIADAEAAGVAAQ